MSLFAVVLSACGGEEREPLPARVAAFLDDEVAAQPAGIEQRVRQLPGVTAVEVITKEQAYERFRESLTDRPDLLEGAKPQTLPASLEVTITDGAVAEAVELVIGAFDGISDTLLAAGEGDVEAQEKIGVLVRLADGATREQHDAIEKVIRQLPRTEAISFETPEQARDRLRKRCRGKGDLATSFEQVSLPEISTAFRFRIGLHGGEVPQLATLQDLEGVDDMLLVPAEVV